MTNRNYRIPAVDHEWANSRETHIAVATAIHAISDSKRSPEAIWGAPTSAERDHVERAVAEYIAHGDFHAERDGRYAWGESATILPERYISGVVERRVNRIRIGDKLDLCHDPIADPFDEDYDSEHPEFAFEYEIVLNIERETEDCVRIDFESGFSCGFPPDHWIEVDGEQIRDAAA